MTALQKAKLAAVDGKGKVSDEVAVQFNPATLKLNRANSIDAGKSRGRQVQQYNGTSSTTLSLELEFDTADLDQGGDPVDVRTLTADVTRFVLPGGKGSKQAPPRVRFSWGKFVLMGVMGSANEDLDLFSPEGVPLRAKVSISIKEQDPKFEALETGAGANPATVAPPSGTPAPTGPGTSGGGSGPADRVAEALDGESAADFLSRQGLLPEAWRSIASGVSDVLSLLPGEPIGFNLGGPLGGFSVGGGELEFSGGLEVSLGLEPGSDGRGGPFATGTGGQPDPAGFALAAAGGLTAAVQTAAATSAAQAADASRQAFATPSRQQPGGAPASGPPSQLGQPGAGTGRSRLRDTSGARTQPATAAAPRPVPPAADRRATTYGSGLPLRDRITPDEVQLAGSPWVVIPPREPAPPPRSASPSRCGCDIRRACADSGPAPASAADPRTRAAANLAMSAPVTPSAGPSVSASPAPASRRAGAAPNRPPARRLMRPGESLPGGGGCGCL